MNTLYCNQDLCQEKKCCMKLNGIGTVKAIPDIATVDLGIVTENVNLEAAQKENAVKSNAVINKLYELGISRENVKTASYDIEPVYDYIDGKQIFKTYRVTNTLSVIITDLMMVGKIIDSATSLGVNRVNNINFTVADKSIYYNRALDLAVKDASKKAFIVANSIGVEINSVPCYIVEEMPTAPVEYPMFKMSSEATPILPGQINITAKVEAIFNYKNI